ncbi:unnamed protein product [Gongylonema pulchrum]|uniref:Uncharacterized protein n=1 Tax=Gongylonema pulchrum TaxID=637853 RepID=A0A183DA36_9BILA|nr:unnamed protein product [Gongylonema pulchrum]
MRYYVVDSEDPNGDVGDVRIAATENSKFSCETVLLAQKIFLLDEQIQPSTEPEEKKKRTVELSGDGAQHR